MPNYRADPDIRAVLEANFTIPADLDPAEAGRLQEFLRCDQALETFYASNQPGRPRLISRPPHRQRWPPMTSDQSVSP